MQGFLGLILSVCKITGYQGNGSNTAGITRVTQSSWHASGYLLCHAHAPEQDLE
jgi:hypothetical protein